MTKLKKVRARQRRTVPLLAAPLLRFQRSHPRKAKREVGVHARKPGGGETRCPSSRLAMEQLVVLRHRRGIVEDGCDL